MKTLTLTKDRRNAYIELPAEFVDTFMPQASGEALKVYLYLCRAALDPSIALSVNDMAERFDVTPRRVMQALSYWAEQGLLVLSFTGDELSEIRLTAECSQDAASPQPIRDAAPVPMPVPADGIRLVSDPVPEDTTETAGISDVSADKEPVSGSAPSLPGEDEVLDLSVLDRDSEFTELLGLAEYYLKRPMTAAQRESLGICYLMFGKQSEIVEYLLEYCIERGHTSYNYIETVARSWRRSGYRTLSEIKAGTALRNKNVYSIMNAFGLGSRSPVREEADYIARWTEDFKLPVIILACEKTMAAIHSPSFRYADSILSAWKAEGVRTEADVEAADRRFRSRKAGEPAAPEKSGRPNAFRNFDERDTDYDSVIAGYLNH